MSSLNSHIKLHFDIAEKLRIVMSYQTYLFFVVSRRYGNSHKFSKRLHTANDYQTQIKGYLDSNLITTEKKVECEKNHIPLTSFYYRTNSDEVKKYIQRPISLGGSAMYQKPRNLRQEEYEIFEIVIDGYETLLDDIKTITYTKYKLDDVKKYTNKVLRILKEIQPQISVVDNDYRYKTDKYIYGDINTDLSVS